MVISITEETGAKSSFLWKYMAMIGNDALAVKTAQILASYNIEMYWSQA